MCVCVFCWWIEYIYITQMRLELKKKHSNSDSPSQIAFYAFLKCSHRPSVCPHVRLLLLNWSQLNLEGWTWGSASFVPEYRYSTGYEYHFCTLPGSQVRFLHSHFYFFVCRLTCYLLKILCAAIKTAVGSESRGHSFDDTGKSAFSNISHSLQGLSTAPCCDVSCEHWRMWQCEFATGIAMHCVSNWEIKIAHFRWIISSHQLQQTTVNSSRNSNSHRSSWILDGWSPSRPLRPFTRNTMGAPSAAPQVSC